MPQTQPPLQKLPLYTKLTVRRDTSTAASTASMRGQQANTGQIEGNEEGDTDVQNSSAFTGNGRPMPNLIETFAGRDTTERVHRSVPVVANAQEVHNELSKDKQAFLRKLSKSNISEAELDGYGSERNVADADVVTEELPTSVLDFNKRIAEQQGLSDDEEARSQASSGCQPEDGIPAATGAPAKPSPGIVQNAFDRMRPRRIAIEVAEVTVGDTTTTMALGPTRSKRQKIVHSPTAAGVLRTPTMQRFSSSMQSFAAPGAQCGELDDSQDLSSSEQGSDSEDDQKPVNPISEDDDGNQGLDQGAESAVLGASNDGESSESEELANGAEPDQEYVDEKDEKARESARVAALIRQAEEAAALPSEDNIKRASNILKGRDQKDSTIHLIQPVDQSIDRIDVQLHDLQASLEALGDSMPQTQPTALPEAPSPEERLSLIVSKVDFARMNIVGQFNLGFILAVRPSRSFTTTDELFIIDQHASDEKSNFERLQSTTIVQNQRLVHPYQLDLTAIEEEIILENDSALLKNGFLITIDNSGGMAVGQRCKLISLPMSREVTFDLSDLEELIALLTDSTLPFHATMESIPRPSKVRKMFAMRACRSSVMIGKSLSLTQMGKLVRRMGEIDKPWNCPHGRPTMRHVLGLKEWEGWKEGRRDMSSSAAEGAFHVDWAGWEQKMQGGGSHQTQRESNDQTEEELDGTNDVDGEVGQDYRQEGGGGDNYEEETEDENEEEAEREEADKDDDEDQEKEDELGKGLRSILHSRFAHGR